MGAEDPLRDEAARLASRHVGPGPRGEQLAREILALVVAARLKRDEPESEVRAREDQVLWDEFQKLGGTKAAAHKLATRLSKSPVAVASLKRRLKRIGERRKQLDTVQNAA